MNDDLAFIHPLNDVKQDGINYHQIIKNHIKRKKAPRNTYNFQKEISQIPRQIQQKRPVNMVEQRQK